MCVYTRRLVLLIFFFSLLNICFSSLLNFKTKNKMPMLVINVMLYDLKCYSNSTIYELG